MKLVFERGAFAADAYGLAEGETFALGKNAAGGTIKIPAFAKMIDEAHPGENLEIIHYGSLYQPGAIGWEDYQTPYRFQNNAVVAADGVVWGWSLRGIEGESFAKYLNRLGDEPRDLIGSIRNQRAIKFRMPLEAVAYEIKTLLSKEFGVNLIDPYSLGELDDLPSGNHAIFYYDVYWVFEK